MSAFRRLFYEAFTLAAQDIKSRLDRGDDAAPRRIPGPERNQRYVNLQNRLVGVVIQDDAEPSDALVDTFCEMFESNRLRWVQWEKLTKKDDDVGSKKADPVVRPDKSNVLKLEHDVVEDDADMSTDLMLRFALQRRAIAMDMAFILRYEVSERWHDHLFRHRLRKAPPGFMRMTQNQLEEADKALFSHMSRACRGGIVPRADGARPLDTALVTAMESAEVSFFILPRQASSSNKRKADEDAAASSAKKEKAKAKAAAKAAARAAAAAPKGKGKGKLGKPTRSNMPTLLIGGINKTPAGESICFDLNLKKCTVVGPRCPKGVHTCCSPGCITLGAFLDHANH